MKNKLLYIIAITLIFFGTGSYLCAQEPLAPKWVGKIQKKSILSVRTYDKEKNLLSMGTGFFITADGTAIADYKLFKGAYSAVVTDMKGIEYPVTHILGADETYSLVKFKVTIKKSIPLALATQPLTNDNKVYVIGFSNKASVTCPQAEVREVFNLSDNTPYYTLSDTIDEKYLGAPVFDEKGLFVGVVQPSVKKEGFAIGASYFKNLAIEAITDKANSMVLNNIHIAKALPESMEEALVYLYFKSKNTEDEEYIAMLNDFISAYPKNAEGYIRRATPLVDTHRFDEADADLQQYLTLAEDKGTAHFNIGNVIASKLQYQPTPQYDKWTFPLALQHTEEAISLKPDNFDFKLQKGKILMISKQYKEAVAFYDSLNNTSLRTPGTYYAAFLAHESNGDSISVQIEQLDSAISIFGTPLPKEAATYVMQRAQLYESAGKYRYAVRDFETYSYLSNSKMNDKFYYDKAILELKGRMYQQCIEDIDKAILHNSKEPAYYIVKSEILMHLNMLDESIESSKTCLSIDPNNSDAYRTLGYALIQKDDKNSARQYLDKAVALGDKSAQEIIDKFYK